MILRSISFVNSYTVVLIFGYWLIVHYLVDGTSHILMSPYLLDVGGSTAMLFETKQYVLISTNSQFGFSSFIYNCKSYISILAI